MKYKKNAIDLTDLALAVVILGITVSIGAVVLTGIRDNQLTNTDTSQVVNESITGNNITGEDLDVTWVASVNNVTNATDGTIVGAGNYTTTISAIDGTGNINLTAGGAGYNNTALFVDYTVYNATDPRFSLPNDATAGLAEYGNWFDIIVIVGVAGLILTLIFLAFGGSRGGGESSGGVAY